VRVIPTSMTAAPGLTISAVIRPGLPTAATRMSAARVCAARSSVREWPPDLDAAAARERAADDQAPPDDDGAGARDGDPVLVEQLHDPDRRGTARGDTDCQFTSAEPKDDSDNRRRAGARPGTTNRCPQPCA